MKAYCRIVERGSFVRAAEDLGVSPALLSREVKLLDSSLGCSLLSRTTRSMALTEHGRQYYDEARRILAEIDAAEERVRLAAGSVQGRLRVNAPHSFGQIVLGPALPGFLDRYPRVEIELSLDDHVCGHDRGRLRHLDPYPRRVAGFGADRPPPRAGGAATVRGARIPRGARHACISRCAEGSRGGQLPADRPRRRLAADRPGGRDRHPDRPAPDSRQQPGAARLADRRARDRGAAGFHLGPRGTRGPAGAGPAGRRRLPAADRDRAFRRPLPGSTRRADRGAAGGSARAVGALGGVNAAAIPAHAPHGPVCGRCDRVAGHRQRRAA
ncbi:LysR family transcriptional regulator [Rhodobacteraceae bacterium 2CG4]|uniref:LysR family transcriptional regulator n=1 Tax=Halovulum marinum TaxID=2662447 RepID=A0A6L5Z233_9RHOB|nr:LysR family transcriptional regulator [Halovulum marinum]